MGDLFPGPGFRACSHSGCRAPAVATLSFEYSSRRVWLDPLQAPPSPSTYDLCDTHAGRFSPPRGWESLDRRDVAPEVVHIARESVRRADRGAEAAEPAESPESGPQAQALPMVLPEII